MRPGAAAAGPLLMHPSWRPVVWCSGRRPLSVGKDEWRAYVQERATLARLGTVFHVRSRSRPWPRPRSRKASVLLACARALERAELHAFVCVAVTICTLTSIQCSCLRFVAVWGRGLHAGGNTCGRVAANPYQHTHRDADDRRTPRRIITRITRGQAPVMSMLHEQVQS